MKTKFARQNYSILAIGILVAGFLFCFTGYQLIDTLDKRPHHNMVRALEDTKQPINKLRGFLEMTPGIRVRPFDKTRDSQFKQLSIKEV